MSLAHPACSMVMLFVAVKLFPIFIAIYQSDINLCLCQCVRLKFQYTYKFEGSTRLYQ